MALWIFDDDTPFFYRRHLPNIEHKKSSKIESIVEGEQGRLVIITSLLCKSGWGW